MNKENGGAAFPSAGVVINYDKNEHQQGAYEGMSLRDYFAAKCMAISLQPVSSNYGVQWATEDHLPKLAEFAYKAADAMLAAREVSK